MYVNNTGLPSSTEILAPYIPTEWFTEESRDRGDAVHGATSAYLQGLFFPRLPPEWQKYFDSARRWCDQMVDRVVLVETRLISKKYAFCGKPDLICVLRGESFNALPDFKTSQAVERWWSLQNASYRYLAKEERNIPTGRGISVRLKPNGSGGLVDDCLNYQLCLNKFFDALTAYYKNKSVEAFLKGA